jgi:hypothetical protein
VSRFWGDERAIVRITRKSGSPHGMRNEMRRAEKMACHAV